MLVMVYDLLFQVPSSGLEPETSPLPREVVAEYKVVMTVIYSEKYIKYYLNSAKISA